MSFPFPLIIFFHPSAFKLNLSTFWGTKPPGTEKCPPTLLGDFGLRWGHAGALRACFRKFDVLSPHREAGPRGGRMGPHGARSPRIGPVGKRAWKAGGMGPPLGKGPLRTLGWPGLPSGLRSHRHPRGPPPGELVGLRGRTPISLLDGWGVPPGPGRHARRDAATTSSAAEGSALGSR